MVQGKIVARVIGAEAVLVPTVHLLGLAGIEEVLPAQATSFFHIVTDRHEVIFAEGVAAETMYLGPETLARLAPRARAGLSCHFAVELAGRTAPVPALKLVSGARARLLVRRHRDNRKPLQPGRRALV